MMDRISNLPESIIHHILFFLEIYPAELVRMSVLSKTWFHLTASFPVLDFGIRNFRHVSRHRQSFFKYVEYTTSRFCQQNLTAHKLKLVTRIRGPAELDIVNRCLELLLKNGVRELQIYLPHYRLPNLLSSVSVLKSLTICNSDLSSSFLVDAAVKFTSLIHLELSYIHLDDEVIKHLAASCPLLQVFDIRRCHGFKTFCIHGHQNLQDVRIKYSTLVERIDIDAPNLSTIFIHDIHGRGALQMNLASCKKLTTVTYIGRPFPKSNGFNDFLSNFPFIEKLVLATTYKCSNLKLSSHSLKTLALYNSRCDLEEIEFNTPNLVSFTYTCNISQLLPMLKIKHWSRTHLKACMHWYPDVHKDIICFQKLRQFLDKKNGFKVFNLYIHAICSQKFTEFGRLKSIELPPYELEHVELQLESNEESSAYIGFVDVVLRCCRPRSLTLRSSSPLTDFEDVVKFTYEKLLEQEDQCRTSVQIVWPSSSSSESQKHSMGLKSSAMALHREGKIVSFIKEEGT